MELSGKLWLSEEDTYQQEVEASFLVSHDIRLLYWLQLDKCCAHFIF